jgi:hypothetical protein
MQTDAHRHSGRVAAGDVGEEVGGVLELRQVERVGQAGYLLAGVDDVPEVHDLSLGQQQHGVEQVEDALVGLVHGADDGAVLVHQLAEALHHDGLVLDGRAGAVVARVRVVVDVRRGLVDQQQRWAAHDLLRDGHAPPLPLRDGLALLVRDVLQVQQRHGAVHVGPGDVEERAQRTAQHHGVGDGVLDRDVSVLLVLGLHQCAALPQRHGGVDGLVVVGDLTRHLRAQPRVARQDV